MKTKANFDVLTPQSIRIKMGIKPSGVGGMAPPKGLEHWHEVKCTCLVDMGVRVPADTKIESITGMPEHYLERAVNQFKVDAAPTIRAKEIGRASCRERV